MIEGLIGSVFTGKWTPDVSLQDLFPIKIPVYLSLG